MLSSLISWSFSLIISGLLAREVTHRVRGADYRAVGAAAYLGIGSVWALGLSSSAALIMAAPGIAAPVDSRDQRRHPAQPDPAALAKPADRRRDRRDVDGHRVLLRAEPEPGAQHGRHGRHVRSRRRRRREAPEKPGEWLEYSPLLSIVVGAVRPGVSRRREVASKGASVILELNHYVFLFLIAGILLHWRPRSFVKSIAAAVPSVAGVLVQYPMYAGHGEDDDRVGAGAAAWRTSSSTSPRSTPIRVLVGVYSAFLGLFVPSAGGKWLIEAPYMLDAAKTLHVHLGWVVQTYNATEALANLIHPFWMLPLLGILGLKARDIVGYSALQFVDPRSDGSVPGVDPQLHAAVHRPGDSVIASRSHRGTRWHRGG